MLLRLFENSIPDNNLFWFWYDPDGDSFVDVEGTHTLAAVEELGYDHFEHDPETLEDYEILHAAIDDGWVRGRYGNLTGTSWDQQGQTLALQGTLKGVHKTALKISEKYSIRELYFDVNKNPKIFDSHHLKGERLEYFLKRGRIPGRMIQESYGRPLDGGWITDDGEFIECHHDKNIHHSDIACNALEDGDEYDDPEMATYTKMEDDGWIRVAVETVSINGKPVHVLLFDLSLTEGITRRAYRKIRELVSRKYRDMPVSLETRHRYHNEISRSEFYRLIGTHYTII